MAAVCCAAALTTSTNSEAKKSKPVTIDIPLHPELARTIAATRTGSMSFLETELGKPYAAAGFGNKFREWCDEAGLPHCSAHGLRKAAATLLAEHGATAHEIMAVTGHQSLEEVERYTRAVGRAKLADDAVAKLGRDLRSVPLNEEDDEKRDNEARNFFKRNGLAQSVAPHPERTCCSSLSFQLACRACDTSG